MKKIIILTAIFIATICKGQTPVYTIGQSPANIQAGSYIKDTNNILNKFAGTWFYNQGGNIFKITLAKVEMVELSDYYTDDIYGNYSYVVNGNTVVNTESYSGESSKIQFAFMNFETEKIALLFYDPERPKIGSRVFLTYSNVGGVEKLHWELKVMGYLPQLPGEPPAQLDFRVPTDCVLIKQ